MNKEDYVSNDVAMDMREMGFDAPSHEVYLGNGKIEHRTIPYTNSMLFAQFCIAPSLYEAQKWIREKYFKSIEPYTCASGWNFQICKASDDCTMGSMLFDSSMYYDKDNMNDCGAYDTYEKALNEGIKHTLLKIINGDDTHQKKM